MTSGVSSTTRRLLAMEKTTSTNTTGKFFSKTEIEKPASAAYGPPKDARTGWDLYNDRTLTSDREMIKEWNDNLSNLLIFVSRFLDSLFTTEARTFTGRTLLWHPCGFCSREHEETGGRSTRDHSRYIDIHGQSIIQCSDF
jgi:hypothetical protein